MVCKYCGEPLGLYYEKKSMRACGKCREKVRLLPRFAKALDDLREKLGLERLGASNEK